MQGRDSDWGTEGGRGALPEPTLRDLLPSLVCPVPPAEASALIGILPGATDPGIRLKSEPPIQRLPFAAWPSQGRFTIVPLAGTQS